MANRFIGGVLTSKPQANTPFSSRASTGTYFDSAGVLRTAPINQPRLNYNLVGSAWTQPSVLIEPATTNIVSYSQDFSQASYWGPNNSTIGSAAGTTPDGTNTAFKIQENTSNNVHGVEQQLGDTNGRAYTVSIFAKAAERSWLILDNTHQGVANYRNWFNLSNGTIGTMASGNERLTMTNVGNGWYRCSVTRPAGTAGSHRVCIYSSTGDGTITYTGTSGSGILVWGCQLEYQLGMTSYIISPSTGVGTRAQDVVGPGVSGIYSLEDRQTTTATDDQATVESFTSTGSYSWTAPSDVTSVEVLVVAGGGGGGSRHGGGGGAGGLLYNSLYPVTPGNTYTVVVGAGGAGAPSGGSTTGSQGLNSQFNFLVAVGGGPGTSRDAGFSGGSGGGGRGNSSGAGGAGIAGQGNAGGPGSIQDAQNLEGIGGGGGGAGAPGFVGRTGGGAGGGSGLFFNISGSTVGYAGGGGGGGGNDPGFVGGSRGGEGGGGNGNIGSTSSDNATSGTANTGGGGGAGGHTGATNYAGKSGGSGIVIVKYKRTPAQITNVSNAAQVVQKFTVSNTWTAPVGVTQVEALVVAGGGGGANLFGGGGAGGVVYNSALTVVPGQTYTIGVGTGAQGGAAATNTPINGFTGFGSGIGTGSELVTNGSGFTNTAGWAATTATLSVPQTGTLRITPNISVNGTASQSITTVIGTTYLLLIKVTSDVGRLLRIRVGTTQVSDNVNDQLWTERTRDSLDNGATGAGFYSQTFTATSTTTWINLQVGNGTGQLTDISFISVRPTTISAFGGGGGGAQSVGLVGGSGGGGGDWAGAGFAGGAGTVGQGNVGGRGAAVDGHGGGGGGAVSAGANGVSAFGGRGGTGISFNITGNLEHYAGGGGGGVYTGIIAGAVGGQGGTGGGGAGGRTEGQHGQRGAANTGGGGGGGTRNNSSVAGGAGGSGVVVLRYRVPQVCTFQDSGSWTCPSGVTSVQALIVAGGGTGNQGFINARSCGGGGGGGGGVVYSSSVAVTPGQTYSVIVGAGGQFLAGLQRTADGGKNSSFAGITAIGGGGGGMQSRSGGNGGSGGGGVQSGTVGGTGVYGQGHNGGIGNNYQFTAPVGSVGGGGGGAGGRGTSATGLGPGPELGGTGVRGLGGAGLAYSISGTSVTYSAGGNGSSTDTDAFPRADNTGNGGDGAGGGMDTPVDRRGTYRGGSGGSGIVIIRWYGA